MIDYQSILKQLQGQTEQEQQPSLFPAGPLGNLSSILRFIGTAKAAPLADLQKNYLSQLTQASSLGISSLRKLYADPKFIQDSKTLGVTPPPLPEETPQEIQESRTRGFYGKVAEAGKIGGGFEDKTLSEQRRKALGLAEQQFPEVAQREGFTQKISPGTINMLLKGIFDPKTDPTQVVAAINMAVTLTGGDPSALQELETNLKYNISPYAQLQIDTMKANIKNRIASSNLTDEKKRLMQAEFDLNVKRLEEEVNNLKDKGQYTEALTALTKKKVEWGDKYEPLKERLAESQISQRQAYVNYLNSNIPLRESQTALNHARIMNLGNTASPLKMQEKFLVDEINAGAKLLIQLQSDILVHPSMTDTLQPQIDEELKNLGANRKALADLRKQLTDGQTKPKVTGVSRGDPDKIVLTNTNSSLLFAHITDPNSKIPMNKWLDYYNNAKNNPQFKDLSGNDWDVLKQKLILQAAKNSNGEIDLSK